MKRAWRIWFLVLACIPLFAANTPWQYGRIADVNKSVTTKTKAWVVNTPITEDEITYTISVQVLDKTLVGTYDLTPEESPPPEEWTTNYPVKVQVVGDRLYVRAPTGELRLHIVRRKGAKPMTPLTADEKKRLEQIEAPAGSLVGFSDDANSGGGITTKSAEPPPQLPPPPPLPPTTGLVNVRSTPYLSEVFVDGDSMGYTPAKVSLPPGKHAFRVEKPGYKPWTKEIMITIGSELTLDASLDKK
jgi:hypothetical protein